MQTVSNQLSNVQYTDIPTLYSSHFNSISRLKVDAEVTLMVVIMVMVMVVTMKIDDPIIFQIHLKKWKIKF